MQQPCFFRANGTLSCQSIVPGETFVDITTHGQYVKAGSFSGKLGSDPRMPHNGYCLMADQPFNPDQQKGAIHMERASTGVFNAHAISACRQAGRSKILTFSGTRMPNALVIRDQDLDEIKSQVLSTVLHISPFTKFRLFAYAIDRIAGKNVEFKVDVFFKAYSVFNLHTFVKAIKDAIEVHPKWVFDRVCFRNVNAEPSTTSADIKPRHFPDLQLYMINLIKSHVKEIMA